MRTGHTIRCAFEAAQLLNGEILLHFRVSWKDSFLLLGELSDFSGVTSDGIEVKSISGLNMLETAGGDATARTTILEATYRTTVPRTAKYGITNYRFDPPSLDLRLKNISDEIHVKLTQTEAYPAISRRIKTLRSIEVTCEAEAKIKTSGGLPKLNDVVGDVCRIASIGAGSRVEWVYCDLNDSKGNVVKRIHAARIAKPFTPLQLIDTRSKPKIEMFFENTYPTYCHRRHAFGLDDGTIDAYLDGKAEEDFLEFRAAKLAVCLEKLKAVFIKAHKSGTNEFIVDESVFNPLIPTIKTEIEKMLSDAGITKKKGNNVAAAGKIRALNRKPFEYYIKKLINEIKLQVTHADVVLFVRCRNKIVHEGEFYTRVATAAERKECPPLPSPTQEYFFMLDFLDRIFLKILGYSGLYNSYRHVGGAGASEQLLS